MTQLNKKQLKPIEFPGLIRLGKSNDGGYVIPKSILDMTEILLSFGIANDWSFEQEFRKLNPKVQIEAYDPMIGTSIYTDIVCNSLVRMLFNLVFLRLRRARWHFNRCMEFSGYLSQYRKFFCFEKNVQHFRKRISRSVNQVSIEPRQIFNRLISESAKTAIFVKIDIEGAEYTVIDQIALFSQSINCIVIECHAIDRRLDFSRLIETFLKDFSIVHIHGNNFGPMNERENFPTTIELTLVNNALLAAFVEPACLSMKTYPVGDLDQANNPYIPDHALIFD